MGVEQWINLPFYTTPAHKVLLSRHFPTPSPSCFRAVLSTPVFHTRCKQVFDAVLHPRTCHRRSVRRAVLPVAVGRISSDGHCPQAFLKITVSARRNGKKQRQKHAGTRALGLSWLFFGLIWCHTERKGGGRGEDSSAISLYVPLGWAPNFLIVSVLTHGFTLRGYP
jgi:hypothetical protein